MAEKQTNKERLKDITDSIETGIKELFESDKYRQYLATMSRFHKYSVNNTMLIYMQRPDATHVPASTNGAISSDGASKRAKRALRSSPPRPSRRKLKKQSSTRTPSSPCWMLTVKPSWKRKKSGFRCTSRLRFLM